MNYNIILRIEDGTESSIEVSALSKDKANIFILAKSTQEAIARIPEGQEKAIKAMKDYTPRKAPETAPERHHKILPLSIEEMDAYKKDFRETKEGSRFIEKIEKAKTFRENKEAGLNVFQFKYLAALAYENIYEGITAAYNIAYEKGYKAGRKAGKK